jgi:protein-L-isoaspartate(D-aspartate) O-methyltransferase
MDAVDRFEKLRQEMVSQQIARRGIRDERLLAVMRQVPRQCFVLEEDVDLAYQDRPLSIGYGQTISQPFIIARMTELLKLSGKEVVLEIGTGSGYQAAVLAGLVDRVYSIEYLPDLAVQARKRLADLGYNNIVVCQGDGSLGLSEYAPFDGIMVTAASPQTPQTLLDQLAEHGRLVIPVGGRPGQMLLLWQRSAEGFNQTPILPVAFVPLRGTYGWSSNEWEANFF